ncbi:MAG: double-strand break repair protein AddB [Bosea sp. (in: a-proteobacteria)]
MTRDRPNLYTISAGVPFLETLTQALLHNELGIDADWSDPATLASTTIYLPTRRAARALTSILAHQAGGRAVLLPRIVPLGDVDEAETGIILSGAMAQAGSSLLPIDPLARRFILSQLVLAWGKSANRSLIKLDGSEPDLVPSTFAQAFGLAGNLSDLLDQMQVEGIALERLKGLDAARFDKIWSFITSFFDILAETWPNILAERQRIDPVAHRNLLLEAERQRLETGRPTGPVIAAGSTGTQPVTARLLATISRMPNGAVILPDLDTEMSDEAWLSMAAEPAPTHPQASLHHLLEGLRSAREAVQVLGLPTQETSARARVVRAAMLPAALTADWAQTVAALPDEVADDAMRGLELIEAADEREQALTIALVLRKALETPDATAALVTPDRGLADRVRAELRRWNIDADDSAGVPLSQTRTGELARLVLQVVLEQFELHSLLALLSHPFCRLGLPREAVEQGCAVLEIGLLRGSIIDPGWDNLNAALASWPERLADRRAPAARKRLTEADRVLAEQVIERLGSATEPLRACLTSGTPVDFGSFAQAHAEAVAALVGEPEEAAASASKTEEIEREALDALLANIAALELLDAGSGHGADYRSVFQILANEATVRRPFTGHPRVRIWGLLEGRLLSADTLVLGGLSEGIWPPAATTEPFLNRPMRTELGLPSPERRIGQTAHDLVQAVMSPHAVLVRALKEGGTEAIPSRFWQRLKAVTPKTNWDAALRRGQSHVDLARALEATGEPTPIAQPKPSPPARLQPTSLSVTEIDTLYRDPYAVYAKHVLKLDPLEPLHREPGASDLGSIVHQAIADLAKASPTRLPPDALALLAQTGDRLLREHEHKPEVRPFWWPRFLKTMQGFIDFERPVWEKISHMVAESSAAAEFELADGTTFRLRCRADRIEVLRNERLAIVDFKTGSVPSAKMRNQGFAPQLFLEAALAQAGAFGADVPRYPIAALDYVALKPTEVKRQPALDPKPGEKVPKVPAKKGAPKPEKTAADLEAQEAANGQALADETAKHLARLLEQLIEFRAGKRPFSSRVAPQHISYSGPFDHLSRYKEWSAAPGGDGADDLEGAE